MPVKTYQGRDKFAADITFRNGRFCVVLRDTVTRYTFKHHSRKFTCENMAHDYAKHLVGITA